MQANGFYFVVNIISLFLLLHCCFISATDEASDDEYGVQDPDATPIINMPSGNYSEKNISRLYDFFFQGPVCEDLYLDFQNMSFSLKTYGNCEYIHGSIYVYMQPDQRDITMEEIRSNNFTFPKIRQVSDYIMVYETFGLSDLGEIFPNLSVIMGKKLFLNLYSLVIMNNPDLQQIGLSELTHIQRGSVRIQGNKELCYINTIDWERFAQFGNDLLMKKKKISMNHQYGCMESFQSCQENGVECYNGNCVGEGKCQRRACPDECKHACFSNATSVSCDCHEECLSGCLKPNDATECHGCRNYVLLNNTCVPDCPKGTYKSLYSQRCLKPADCMFMGWYVKDDDDTCVRRCGIGYQEDHKRQLCIKCRNETCPNICCSVKTEARILKLADAYQYRNCQIMQCRLTFEMNYLDDAMFDTLSEVFSTLEEVDSLAVQVSNIDTLAFLKNLKRINGKNEITHGNTSYSLYVIDNKVLSQLWFDVNEPCTTVITGRAFFQLNPNLCMTIIDKVSNASSVVETSEDISLQTNAPYCENVPFDVNVTNLPPMETPVAKVSVSWRKPDILPAKHVFGYYFYYKISKFKNATRLPRREEDSCGPTRWKLLRYINLNSSVITLLPYVQYAWYMVIKVPPHIHYRVETGIRYFTTSISHPPGPALFEAQVVNSTAMLVSWSPPRIMSGELKHYRLVVTKTCDDSSRVRNVRQCAISKNFVSEAPLPDISIGGGGVVTGMEDMCIDRMNEDNYEGFKRQIKQSDEERDKESFVDEVLNELYPRNTDSQNDGWTVLPFTNPKKAKEYGLMVVEGSPLTNASSSPSTAPPTDATTVSPPPITTTTLQTTTESEIFADKMSDDPYPFAGEEWPAFDLKKFDEYIKSLIPNKTSCSKPDINGKCKTETFNLEAGLNRNITLTNLCHFARYEIDIETCVYDKRDESTVLCSQNRRNRSKMSKRTAPDPTVDAVTDMSVKVNDTDPNTVMVRFKEPVHPNGYIKYYLIFWRLVNTDHSREACCSKWKYDQRGMCEINEELPGSYELRLVPVSLANEADLVEGGARDELAPYPFTFRIVDSNPRKYVLEVVVVCLVIALLAASVFFYCVWKRRAKNKNPDKYLCASNADYSSVGNYIPDEYEVPIDKVTTVRLIGSGHFGEVYEGIAKDVVKGEAETRVAIKTLLGPDLHAKKRNEFLKEANTMKTFNSCHVVRLLGVVSATERPMVIMEYMGNGDLKSFLQRSRPDTELTSTVPLPRKEPPSLMEKLKMCLQIADGMAYLAENKFVHRDLAARNCLVDDGHTVKIADFGLTRDVYQTDYYRLDRKGKLPVRWMSPESLKDGVFDSRSDVFSYGIVLWEISTLAEQPYQGKANEEISRYVIDGGYLERPKNCNDRLYDMMKLCWHYNPANRPTFVEIVEMLVEDCADETFRNNSFYFNRSEEQPTEILDGDDEDEDDDEEMMRLGAGGDYEADTIDESYPMMRMSKEGGGGGGYAMGGSAASYDPANSKIYRSLPHPHDELRMTDEVPAHHRRIDIDALEQEVEFCDATTVDPATATVRFNADKPTGTTPRVRFNTSQQS